MRRVIEIAPSPERLLFRELPEVVNLQPFDEGQVDLVQVELFFELLNSALQVLAGATPHLREQARDEFLTACALPSGESGWQMFLTFAGEMLPYAANPALLPPLLRRAAETRDARAALESVLALIANRPIRTWTDIDTDRFSAQTQFRTQVMGSKRRKTSHRTRTVWSLYPNPINCPSNIWQQALTM